jgi:ABC-2 type transport system permease protein
MKILDIALKDLMHSFRSLFAVGMMLVAPMLIVGMISLAFGGMVSGRTDLPQLKVAVVNLDVPPAGLPGMGQALVDMLNDPSVSSWLKPQVMADEASARTAVDKQQAGLAVLIPANFTQSMFGGSGGAKLVMVQDPTLTVGPTVVKNMASSLLDAVSGGRLAAEMAAQPETGLDPKSVQGITAQFQTWFTSFQRTLYHSPDSALAITAPASTGGSSPASATQNIMGMVMAGMMIFFAFYTGAYAMMSILREVEEGTLARLFTTPTSRTTILTGKFLAVFLMVIVQSLVLMAAATLAFKIQWGQPLPTALALIAQVVAAGGLGVLLISFVKTSRQAGPVLGGALTGLGMLGGLFTVAVQMPAGFETLGKITPQGWVMQAWRMVFSGSSVSEILLPFGVSVILGVAAFIIGARIFNRRFA